MKIYDYALKDNYADIRRYSGGVFDEVLEMQEIWKTLGTALDGVRESNIAALDDQFVATCSSRTLAELERWLYITPDENKPLAERRSVVAALMRGFGHIGEREIIDYLGLFTTGGVAVTFDPVGTVNISITREIEDTAHIADAYYVLNKRIPAHLTLKFHESILPISIKTAERISLYSVATAAETFFDGEFTFDGTIDFSGVKITAIEYMEDGMASTITNKRMELLAAASRGESTLAAITHIAFGDGGADSSGRPLTPDPAQEQLNNELGRYAIDEAESPVFNVSRFTATIPVGELAGAEISEAGLYDADGNLVAVKNMAPRTKDGDLQLVYSFDDEFVGG